MEGLQPLHRRLAGIDVHRMLHVVTVVIEQPDGAIEQTSREFGGFRRDCRALAAWLRELRVELVVMVSRVGVIRPRGVGIFRPVGGVPKSVSKHFFEGAILQR